MTRTQTRTILSLSEYSSARFPKEAISDALGETLWRNYNNQVAVDFPSPKTGKQWQLTPQGWVGYIPLNEQLGLSLQPKVELENLFRMLEYAYRLKSFHFLDGLIDCQSIEEFYERFANILARRVLDRGRKGFYHAYLPKTDQLPFVRGRMNIRKAIRTPWDVKPECHYEEHTADIDENQILAWTLSIIAKGGICTERVLPTVRRAYRSLQGLVSVKPYNPKDCIGRIYNRLNDDYQPLHALCRFFLEHSGPNHKLGDRTVLPFLVNMERLYELFVAEWLKEHLYHRMSLKIQEKVDIGEGQALSFTIDLVLYDNKTGKAICVLDTKYKATEKTSPDDVAKVVAYAEMKGCKTAVLVYPVQSVKPLNERVGNIQVKSMTFALKGNIEQAGQEFIQQLQADWISNN
ncbi:MAG: McrC family protein [Waddliaceae bacterium]